MLLENKIAVRARRIFSDVPNVWTQRMEDQLMSNQNFTTTFTVDQTPEDNEYQAAVKKNDAATMERLLADDFVLVTGSGKTYTKADLLNEAHSGRVVYDHQEDTAQNVRIWGDTATITAKLWEQGTDNGKPFDYTLWFTDIYVRAPAGWRYVFGQSSLPLPRTPE